MRFDYIIPFIPPSNNQFIGHNQIRQFQKQKKEWAKKYDENNWRKGLPCKCYIDSAVRHYFKWQLKEIDEDHWNVMCCIWTRENILHKGHNEVLIKNVMCGIWTHENIPEMQSYKKEVD